MQDVTHLSLKIACYCLDDVEENIYEKPRPWRSANKKQSAVI